MEQKRAAQILLTFLSILTLLVSGVPAAQAAPLPAPANAPTSVTIAGSLQSELGCSGDWDPTCAATHLAYDAGDDVWQGTFSLPGGDYEYKAALNDSWDVNYGLHAQPGGANIPLTLAGNTAVKFYYDDKSHWVTDDASSVIVTVPGSFQSELGCPGDWAPDCLRSWLQDPDGDGIYTLETTMIPAGFYEGKAAINESWDVNYGQGGVQNGPNIPFTVPFNGAKVVFQYDATSHILTILAGHGLDNNVEWDGLRHDSRDLLYRTPGGAVPAGSTVKIRFRTFHDDVSSVKMRLYDVNTSSQSIITMKLAASGVSCYQEDLAGQTCDFYETSLKENVPDNFWYRFIITDGTKTAYYADNTPALDGGLGGPSNDVIDNSYALMVYDPSFTTPGWMKNAVIYQIFPDRFRSGNPTNDPRTGMVRYDDPAIKLPWGTLPEGYCRNYSDGSTNCPWRFDTTPPADSPTKETPRGRDYFGGDLKGVSQQLDYLQSLGVTVLYFNPIFTAKSNHRYDTANYLQIDPNLGTLKDFTDLVKLARNHGMRVVLDGVFNHMSSDSPTFDRYGYYPEVGACESAASDWRAWFTFRPPSGNEPAPCAPSTPGGNDTYYNGWFGFDSIPVLSKLVPAVQDFFLTNPNSVSRYWLKQGAAGWRLDVMGDSSFPAGYWESFRSVVKATKPDAAIIGELWQKDSTLLRFLRGDKADSTMNYRLRDAVIGLLVPPPGSFDSKGFADSGRLLNPSEFAARISSIREDYPDVVYYDLMNLLDSHDTERLRWTLTPGIETTADKEQNAANVAEGKQRVRLASLIQFTMPGAPTVYYGDEVGMTGDDDPDDRRTFPWTDRGGPIDTTMLAHYKTLSQVRKASPALVNGDMSVLLADDANGTIAYGRRTGSSAALIVVNVGTSPQPVTIPVAGYLHDGVSFTTAYAVNTGNVAATVTNGVVQVALGPLSGLVLKSGTVDLTPPSAPANLRVTNEGSGEVALAWNSVMGAAGYNLYRSPLSGGGYEKVNASPIMASTFTDSGLENGRQYYFVVRALDAAGNESKPSNEVTALPHYTIGWANLQWPPSLTQTISVVNRTPTIYGQVWIDGVTNQPGLTPTLRAQVGFGPTGSNPAGNNAWEWVEASFNTDSGNNDEFKGSLLPDSVGTFDYAYRYTTTNGRDWLYADLDGTNNGYSPAQAGKLTVEASSDTTAPAAPANLVVTDRSPFEIDLAWDPVLGDSSLYGYEILRSDTSGGPYAQIARVTAAAYQDTSVAEGATYYYVVRSVDLSFNRSGYSNETSAIAETRTVTVTFNATVPATTDGTGRNVFIAGNLSVLDGGLPDWDPGKVVMTRVDATHWTITLTGKESTQVQYKYTLGDWDHVEKDAACGEIANRTLTLTYGATGVQTVNDNVLNWRNVAPCGN